MRPYSPQGGHATGPRGVALSSAALLAGAHADGRVPPVALHATTIRFADRAYMAIARAAHSQGISVSQFVREAALIRAVLDELDSAEEEAFDSAHDLLAIAREVRLLAEVDPPGPPRRANARRKRSGSAKLEQDG